MNDGDHELGSRIARRLDQSLIEIDQAALVRLRSSRAAALEKAQPQPAWELAPVPARGGAGSKAGSFRYFNPRYLLPLAGLLAVISGMVYWQHTQHIEDLVDIDAKLLSDDLPIDAYLDKGLDSWLKR